MLAVDGSLTVDAGRVSTTLPMDDSTCEGSDVRVSEIVGKVSGPKLKNDAPAGAIPLAIGGSVEVRTGGTAFDAEEPCTVDRRRSGSAPVCAYGLVDLHGHRR